MKDEMKCIICGRKFPVAELFCLTSMRGANMNCVINQCPVICEKCMDKLKRNIIKIDKDETAISLILDFLYEINEDAVKKWIYEKFPHGVGLYE